MKTHEFSCYFMQGGEEKVTLETLRPSFRQLKNSFQGCSFTVCGGFC